jgi:hypothetical protein
VKAAYPHHNTKNFFKGTVARDFLEQAFFMDLLYMGLRFRD